MDTIIDGGTHKVVYDPATRTVRLSGVMRLNGMAEYAPIAGLMSRSLTETEALTVDLAGLEFLNSSGIAVLSKFVIEARNSGTALTIRGSKSIAWQGKSLANLQRLMPTLTMDMQ